MYRHDRNTIPYNHRLTAEYSNLLNLVLDLYLQKYLLKYFSTLRVIPRLYFILIPLNKKSRGIALYSFNVYVLIYILL